MPKNFFWKKNAPTSLASQNAVMISLFYMMCLGRKENVHPGLAIEGKSERTEY